jgi:hypothetical protein
MSLHKSYESFRKYPNGRGDGEFPIKEDNVSGVAGTSSPHFAGSESELCDLYGTMMIFQTR